MSVVITETPTDQFGDLKNYEENTSDPGEAYTAPSGDLDLDPFVTNDDDYLEVKTDTPEGDNDEATVEVESELSLEVGFGVYLGGDTIINLDATSSDDESTSAATRAFSQPQHFLHYKPVGTVPARIWAGHHPIYSIPGQEAMHACIDRYLLSIRWILIRDWNNPGPGHHTHTVTYTTSLRVLQGSEVNAGFKLGASYKGMTIGINGSYRRFQETETVTTKKIKTKLDVPPHSRIVFYQKQYLFGDVITFVNDAWGQEWNAGPWGGYKPLTTKRCVVGIMAEEYLTYPAPLPAGPGRFRSNQVVAAQRAPTTRKRENLTARCKDKLAAMRL